MFEVIILIPLNDNDGEIFTAEHHGAFESYVLERLEGYTLLTGSAIGAWIDDAKPYDDTNRVYLVGMKSLLDGSELKDVLGFAKTHYRQEAIYFRYLLGISEIFKG